MPQTKAKLLVDALDKLSADLKVVSHHLCEMSQLLDILNSSQAKTNIMIADIKLFLINNKE